MSVNPGFYVDPSPEGPTVLLAYPGKYDAEDDYSALVDVAMARVAEACTVTPDVIFSRGDFPGELGQMDRVMVVLSVALPQSAVALTAETIQGRLRIAYAARDDAPLVYVIGPSAPYPLEVCIME